MDGLAVVWWIHVSSIMLLFKFLLEDLIQWSQVFPMSGPGQASQDLVPWLLSKVCWVATWYLKFFSSSCV